MTKRPLLAGLFIATVATATSTMARADPPAPPEPPSAGWILVGTSLIVGAAITTAALTIQCGPDDLHCARWASLGIWGGIGVAAAGSVAGLLIVRADARAARLRLSVSIDRSRSGGAPSATLVGTF